MSITREQVADLQPGDVVEVTHKEWPTGTVMRGPLWLNESDTMQVGRIVVRHWDGRHPFDTGLTLTVVSRAPRLYVNHPRTEPVDGDIARDRDGDAWRRSIGRWFMAGGSHSGIDSIKDCKPLTLLWDGQRKQVVP